ncbi:MAG TPA: substrate-binding domain-containing protein [Verrucomicrobiae bacterium]|nr:substrate-binding domain-containing protein [Verrucomicrobiae bacterium]
MAKENGSPAFWFFLIAIAAVSAALWSGVTAPPVRAAGGAIVVIVNSANPVDNLTTSELKKLYLSDRTRWETGKAVAPVMLTPGAPERTAFLKTVCGMNDSDFSNYFMQAAFTGKSATPPKEVTSASALKSFVADTPGAIGFLKAGDFQGNEAGIKAVKIDGAAATDAGYKLKM